MHLVTENLVPFLARIALGVLLALLLAGVTYIMALGIVVSFWERTPLIVDVTAILAIGIGAGVGGSLAWADLDGSRSQILLGVTLGALAGLGGAWVGLQYGKTVYIMGGMPGIAELSGIIRGALIAGNLVPMVHGVARAGWSRYRSTRLRTSRPDWQDGRRSSTAGRP